MCTRKNQRDRHKEYRWKERDTDIQMDRQKERQTYRWTFRETDIHTNRWTDRERQAYIWIDRETDILMGRYIESQKTYMGRKRDRHTNGQKERQINR